MASKFIIDGIDIVDPSSLNFVKEDTVSKERTMNGNLVVDYICTKTKISVAWDILSDEDFNKLMQTMQRRRVNTLESVDTSQSFYKLQYYEPPAEIEDDEGDEDEDEDGDTDTSGEANIAYRTITSMRAKTPRQRKPTTKAKSIMQEVMAFTESITYYPYFTDDAIMWRDIQIEFVEA